MQFLLFDVSATLVFLLAYLATLALQRRRALAVMGAPGSQPRDARLSAPARQGLKPGQAPPQERPATPCCQGWPRLSAPR